jgi:hypothetical protein
MISSSMFYYRGSSGSITSMYGSQSSSPQGSPVTGSFNLFLGMKNYLKITNTNSSAANVDVNITSTASAGSSRTISLPAFSSTELSLHDTATFGTATNSYGTVQVAPNNGGLPVISEVLRLRSDDQNVVEFTAPTGLQ